MAKVFEEEISLTGFLCDQEGELTLGNMVRLLMALARKQDQSLGEAESLVREAGLAWVISHNRFKIRRRPREYQTIRLKTQAVAYNRFFSLRRFWLMDQEGEELVEADTYFCLLDIRKRKMARIPADLVQFYGPTGKEEMPRLPKMKKDLDKVTNRQLFTPYYLDFDRNGHVNNASYLDWLTNALGGDWFKDCQLLDLSIQYEQEILGAGGVDLESDLSLAQESRPFRTYHQLLTPQGRHARIQACWQVRKEDK